MSASDLEQLLHQIADPAEVAWNEETYDLALAGGLTDAERSAFIARLGDALHEGDRRAILTLGHLGAVETRPALFALARTRDAAGPTARRALVLLGDGAAFVHEIADDALRSPAPMERVAAVMDLPKLGGPIAIAALSQALIDPDSTVRLLAWDGLVAAYALAPLLQSPDGKRELSTQVELSRVLLGSDLASFVRMGADEMRWLVRWLDAGASPASLGIAWRAATAPELFARLRLALFAPETALPVDEVAALAGVPRRWAEAMIALRLEELDPRVPEAMVRLTATWTLPVLEELATSETISQPLREQLTQSARALRASVPPVWELVFECSGSIALDASERVLSAVLGSPVSTEAGPLAGNPRDGYDRDATITAHRASDGMRLEMRLRQSMMIPDDPEANNTIERVTLRATTASFATKLAIWHALRDALAGLGCVDGTLAASPAPIVDEAEAAGDTATATGLRAEITAALVAVARSRTYVSLRSPRADDLEAVLAAYPEPLRFETVLLDDCIQGALPQGLVRFANVEHLSLAENELDGRALRGISLVKLTTLSLCGSEIHSLSREDLVGVPNLAELFVMDTKLEDLDVEIIETCPRLRRVGIANTPLARDGHKVAALRTRWQGVVWE